MAPAAAVGEPLAVLHQEADIREIARTVAVGTFRTRGKHLLETPRSQLAP
jgi:hypothetical protein